MPLVGRPIHARGIALSPMRRRGYGVERNQAGEPLRFFDTVWRGMGVHPTRGSRKRRHGRPRVLDISALSGWRGTPARRCAGVCTWLDCAAGPDHERRDADRGGDPDRRAARRGRGADAGSCACRGPGPRACHGRGCERQQPDRGDTGQAASGADQADPVAGHRRRCRRNAARRGGGGRSPAISSGRATRHGSAARSGASR